MADVLENLLVAFFLFPFNHLSCVLTCLVSSTERKRIEMWNDDDFLLAKRIVFDRFWVELKNTLACGWRKKKFQERLGMIWKFRKFQKILRLNVNEMSTAKLKFETFLRFFLHAKLFNYPQLQEPNQSLFKSFSLLVSFSFSVSFFMAESQTWTPFSIILRT